ncbi:MAG: YbjN domain-containing protein [Bacteroidales bacterium]|nr:YbjN domain-containing protein [Bacteroidales bacterium]
MEKNYQKVKNYLLDLEYSIDAESESNGTFIISREDEGIKNMVIACADPILIMEQPLFVLKHETANVLKELLKKNREIVHGAFALDENNRVLFRDTLQIENLDLNELEGSLNSLSILLSEYGQKLVEFAK